MNNTRKRNGYYITYTKKCNHPSLRGFKNKPNYVCLGCGSECDFCDECDKVFTIDTLKKYGGICGKCHSNVNILSLLLGWGQQEGQTSVEQSLAEQAEQSSAELNPPPLETTPISEMRVDMDEDVKDTDDIGIITNILAEDSEKKLWLVEWKDDEHATWEDYDTLKDSQVFKEYIFKQMRQGDPIMKN